MFLIIDGYNVLKYTLGTTLINHAQRVTFINQLDAYAQKRPIRPVVVFDGGPSPFSSQESYGKVTILYAGSQHSADACIVEYSARNANKELLLVTSDRGLQKSVVPYRVSSIDTPLFCFFLRRAILSTQPSTPTTQTIKLSKENNPTLDALMNMAPAPRKHTDNEEEIDAVLDESHHHYSKNDRRLMQKLKKLL